MFLSLALGATVAALATATREADAAYPGTSGSIASDRTTGEGVDNPTGDYEIFTVRSAQTYRQVA